MPSTIQGLLNAMGWHGAHWTAAQAEQNGSDSCALCTVWREIHTWIKILKDTFLGSQNPEMFSNGHNYARLKLWARFDLICSWFGDVRLIYYRKDKKANCPTVIIRIHNSSWRRVSSNVFHMCTLQITCHIQILIPNISKKSIRHVSLSNIASTSQFF